MAMKKKSLSASEIIRRRFKGNKNFITPNKEKTGKINKNTAFELSSGRGFSGGRIYGVTVVSVNKKGETRSLHDKSKAFESRSNAELHINKLRKKFKTKSRRKK